MICAYDRSKDIYLIVFINDAAMLFWCDKFV